MTNIILIHASGGYCSFLSDWRYIFAYESVKKQEEFTERIKREVLKTPVLLINYNTIQRKFCVL